jgi:hypothetical protein
MSHSRIWSNITPANSDNINQGAQQIRNVRVDVDQRLQIDHVNGVSISTDGFHKKTTLQNQSSRPSTASGYSIIWAEDSTLVSQPYMKDGAGNVRQLGVPVGAIMAYLPGYFVNSSNGTYTAVAMTLPDGYVLCEGTAPNDALSPIWNSATRYVPNISDARFLSGNTVANRGVIGGVNTIPAHSGSTFANHTHTVTQPDAHTIGNATLSITQPEFTSAAHNHMWFKNVYLGGGGTTDPYMASYLADGVTAYPMLATSHVGGFCYTKTPDYRESYTGEGRYTNNAALSLTRSVDVAIAAHTHTVTAHSGSSITSSGTGAVTIANDHAANSNLPVYINCSYIIKIK